MRLLLKRHIYKRLICAALAVLLFGGFVPIKSEAADYKYIYKTTPLKQNTNINAKGDTWIGNTRTYHLYKINVPANGYVTIQTNSSSNSMYIYRTVNN